MSDFNNDIKLSFKEKRDLAVQAGLQLIPYGIGSSLSTIYYGAKYEKRIKRLEVFYHELANKRKELNEIDGNIKEKIESLNEVDKAAFFAIIDEFNEKIEREYMNKKIEYFKKYFINTLLNPIKEDNYDERRFFLDVLSSMSILECDILGYLVKENKPVGVGSIKINGVDLYAIIGSISRLKSYGFIKSIRASVFGASEESLRDVLEISPFGHKFCEFCLE
jgi:hypothetical protein